MCCGVLLFWPVLLAGHAMATGPVAARAVVVRAMVVSPVATSGAANGSAGLHLLYRELLHDVRVHGKTYA